MKERQAAPPDGRETWAGRGGQGDCPACGHDASDTLTSNWTYRAEDWLRARLGRPERKRRPIVCDFGNSYYDSGCDCTHMWHSIEGLI